MTDSPERKILEQGDTSKDESVGQRVHDAVSILESEIATATDDLPDSIFNEAMRAVIDLCHGDGTEEAIEELIRLNNEVSEEMVAAENLGLVFQKAQVIGFITEALMLIISTYDTYKKLPSEQIH